MPHDVGWGEGIFLTPDTPGSLDRLFATAGERAERYRRVLARYQHLDVFRDDDAPPAPPAKVTVLVPTLNEEAYVEDACRSLAAQTLRLHHPGLVEVALVDSGSRDRTVRLALPHVDRVIRAPKGKLSALMHGVSKAQGPIVVEADADGYYPPSWLHRMTRRFHEEDVVAVRGDFRYYDSPVLRRVSVPLRRSLSFVGNFPGGVRAYRRDAFFEAGGFDLSVDQRDFWSVWPEEEFRFRRRLQRLGRLVDARDAVCFKSARRGDPLFVKDPRADAFRRHLAQGGTFRDGVTDTLYRARRLLSGRRAT